MFCTLCGKQLADDAQFCDNCGAPLQMQSAPLSVNPDEPATPGITWEDAIAGQGKKKKLWLPAVIGILVLAIVITGGFFLFGKQTVYLVTESEAITAQGITTITRREFDKDGRILSTETITEYPKGYANSDLLREISYKYDQNGNLKSAKLRINDGSNEPTVVNVKYTYDGSILDDIEVDYPDGDCDIRFNSDGKISQVTILENGAEFMVVSYRYHDNGRVKSEEREYYDTVTKAVYNEQGQLTEHSVYNYGEISSKILYEYMDGINMHNKYAYISYHDSKEYYRQTYHLDAEMKNGKPSELILVIETKLDGDKTKVEISGEVEWKGLKASCVPDKIKGDTDEIGGDIDLEECELEFELDKHGNILSYSLTYAGRAILASETEYTAVKVSRDYISPISDPAYSLSWLG